MNTTMKAVNLSISNGNKIVGIDSIEI